MPVNTRLSCVAVPCDFLRSYSRSATELAHNRPTSSSSHLAGILPPPPPRGFGFLHAFPWLCSVLVRHWFAAYTRDARQRGFAGKTTFPGCRMARFAARAAYSWTLLCASLTPFWRVRGLVYCCRTAHTLDTYAYALHGFFVRTITMGAGTRHLLPRQRAKRTPALANALRHSSTNVRSLMSQAELGRILYKRISWDFAA